MAGPLYYRPGSVAEVSSLLVETGGRPLAGATDLMTRMAFDTRPLVDLGALPSLGEIRAAPDGGVWIGATVRLSTLVGHPLCGGYAALVEGAAAVGSVQIRNRATLAGNLCNASPAADTAPGLLVYDAAASVVGPGGRRRLPVTEFWHGPGRTALAAGEWVDGIILPPTDGHGSAYLKLGRTRGVDLAVVGVAAHASPTETRIGLAAVAPTPLLVRFAEDPRGGDDEALPAGLIESLEAAVAPIDDLRASAAYRSAMTLVLARRARKLARQRMAAG